MEERRAVKEVEEGRRNSQGEREVEEGRRRGNGGGEEGRYAKFCYGEGGEKKIYVKIILYQVVLLKFKWRVVRVIV